MSRSIGSVWSPRPALWPRRPGVSSRPLRPGPIGTLGIGVELPMGRPVSLFAEGRLYYVLSIAPDAFENRQFLPLTLGLTLHFWRARQVQDGHARYLSYRKRYAVHPHPLHRSGCPGRGPPALRYAQPGSRVPEPARCAVGPERDDDGPREWAASHRGGRHRPHQVPGPVRQLCASSPRPRRSSACPGCSRYSRRSTSPRPTCSGPRPRRRGGWSGGDASEMRASVRRRLRGEP